jgi:hypothetical protein
VKLSRSGATINDASRCPKLVEIGIIGIIAFFGGGLYIIIIYIYIHTHTYLYIIICIYKFKFITDEGHSKPDWNPGNLEPLLNSKAGLVFRLLFDSCKDHEIGFILEVDLV